MGYMSRDVKRFVDACDQLPSEENADLYEKLIDEEYREFKEAREQNDVVEQLDACMDLIWVILGFCHMKGFQVQEAWNEVAQSNLCKICPETGKVIKRADGKVLKPEGWKSPELAPFIGK